LGNGAPALGISGSGGGARADGRTAINGTGYDLWFIGAQRETIMTGKLPAALDLKSAAEQRLACRQDDGDVAYLHMVS
jgi:hypothetical protein